METTTIYILHSEKLNRFYVGITTRSVTERLSEHNSKVFAKAATARGIPWTLFFKMSCSSRLQAYRIEQHIKSMKSSRYYRNLKSYPEMAEKLKERFAD